ncbi:MAG: GNAT family N-acetyltransferase [Nitrosomonadales bacterium]|nr:GNAT family N-acetyltransferase [Nitrosomonadales bacterium]
MNLSGLRPGLASGLSIEDVADTPDDFLSQEPDGGAFHRAFQAAHIPDFTCRYLIVSRGGKRVAVAPYFLHDFSIATMLPDGWLKNALSWVKFRIACVGHPSTDFGFIDGETSPEVLALINDRLRDMAPLAAYKGFADDLPLPGFVRVRGLPVCMLHIQGDYYAGLDRRRRKDFRKKRQAASTLRVEEYTTLPEPLLPQVYQLYLNTMKQAPVHFETLTPEYFKEMAGLGQFHLYFEGERPIGFLQMLTLGNKANLKYMGMDYQRNRPYYLYFVMCLNALDASLRAGCNELELGASSYQVNRLMGCELVETSVYYRHRNALANWLLGKLKFLLEPTVDELK